ncbi:MAG: hypothetical protein JNM26_01185 [Ideonella sp.]|nr:hypothetical protein [Ideonella sp.]
MSGRLAWLVRQEGRRLVRAAHEVDPAEGGDPAAPPTLDAALAAVAPDAAWPAGLGMATLVLHAADGGPAGLWCSPGWPACANTTAAALDLVAAATPRDWLERMEDRLLGASPSDPGDYAALAWWPGEPADEGP